MKTPAISENTVVSPPRMLVNQLLHAAQLRPLQIHWGIISMHNGKPAHCEYLDTNSRNAEEFHQALRKVTARNPEQVWALFCLTPGDAETPGPDELTLWGIPRFLGVSLATKGVLQIRCWRPDGNGLRELEVVVSET